MALIAGATHMLQWSQQWVAKPQGGANPIKWLLSGDWGLQLAPMNAELVVIADQRFELVRILAADDLRLGVNAGFQGVEAGDGVSFGRARARGVLRIATIGVDLELRRHLDFPV